LSNDFGLQNQSEFPLVSICIPAYNSEATLGATLNSVLSQDYPCLDIVVSDNQSTDHTKEIVQRYAEHGVRYCLHPEGCPAWAVAMPNYIGGYANWNYVLSQGRGDYLCLFHSDDLYEPDTVSKQVEFMQTYPQVGSVFIMPRYIGENGQNIKQGCVRLPKELRDKQVVDFETLFNSVVANSNFLWPSGPMIRRTVLDTVGSFNERQFLTAADLDMWIRIAREYPIGIIDEPLLKYRISDNQGGSEYNKLRTTLANRFRVLDHYLSLPEVYEKVTSDTLSIFEMERSADQIFCAMNLLVQGEEAEAQTRLRKALTAQDFVVARQRPRRLARLLVGLCLLVCTQLGLGTVLGRWFYTTHQWVMRWRRSYLDER